MKKNIFVSFLMVLSIFLAFTSCKDTEEATPALLVEDGLYVYGDGTALTTYAGSGLMKATKNEVGGVDRPGLYELYIAVKASGGFNIANVVAGKATILSPGADFKEVLAAAKDAEEPATYFARGGFAEGTTQFKVPTDGLYHVVYDRDLKKVVVAKVEWGIIGGATPQGWGSSTPLPGGTFDSKMMTFEAKDVILTNDKFKFRYGNNWKIILDGALVRVNCNFGGAVDALVPGGADIANTVTGKYTVTIKWELGKGTTATLVKTGDYTPPAYPAAMYIVGDATAYGWDAPGTKADAIMHKCAGGAPSEGIFWKICYLETGKGFKLSAANWGVPNLGFAEVTSFDAAGVAVATNGGNMSVATSGMYMVVVNLRDNLKKVSVIAPEVYGIGDAFGGYTEKVAANKFVVNNTAKTLTSPAATAAGNLRMYVYHAWIPAWWNAEFNVIAGKIEYRNDGGDQAAVPVTVGKKATLTFDTNVGAIAK